MKKNSKMNGAGVVVIARSAVPATRVYADKWADLWSMTADLKKNSGLAVRPDHYSSNINGLRCALRRAKMKDRVPQDIAVRYDGEIAYLYRG